MEALPDEVLEQLVSWLDFRSKLNWSRVSRRWRAIGSREELWIGHLVEVARGKGVFLSPDSLEGGEEQFGGRVWPVLRMIVSSSSLSQDSVNVLMLGDKLLKQSLLRGLFLLANRYQGKRLDPLFQVLPRQIDIRIHSPDGILRTLSFQDNDLHRDGYRDFLSPMNVVFLVLCSADDKPKRSPFNQAALEEYAHFEDFMLAWKPPVTLLGLKHRRSKRSEGIEFNDWMWNKPMVSKLLPLKDEEPEEGMELESTSTLLKKAEEGQIEAQLPQQSKFLEWATREMNCCNYYVETGWDSRRERLLQPMDLAFEVLAAFHKRNEQNASQGMAYKARLQRLARRQNTRYNLLPAYIFFLLPTCIFLLIHASCSLLLQIVETIICVICYPLLVPVMIVVSLFVFCRTYGTLLIGQWKIPGHWINRLWRVVSLFLISLIPIGAALYAIPTYVLVHIVILGLFLVARDAFRYGFLEGTKSTLLTFYKRDVQLWERVLAEGNLKSCSTWWVSLIVLLVVSGFLVMVVLPFLK